MTGAVLELLGPSSGGIRRHVDVLARGLSDQGWEVSIGGPTGVMDGLASDAAAVPVSMRPDRAVRAMRALRALAADVDLVHAHGLTAGWLAVLAGTGRPVVLTIHNVVMDESAGRAAPALRLLERSLPRRVDHVVAVSSQIARGLPAGTPVDVIVPASPAPQPVRSAGEIRAELGLADGSPLVVSVGRLHPQKALDQLVDAAVLVRRSVPDVTFAVVGDGPSRDELVRRAAEVGAAEAVRFVGARPDGASWLAAADVVALSSRWEGSPLVVAEALQLGRPIVATDVGDVAEIVHDGETGRLVPVGVPDRLAAALVDLLSDPAIARRMADAGRRLALERYGTGALVGAVADVYEKVLVGGRR